MNKKNKTNTTITKKIKFQAGDMKISTLGAALSGVIKTDLGKLAKDINNSENCKKFSEQILTLKMIVTNVIRFSVSSPDTMCLLRSFMDGQTKITIEQIEEIAAIKLVGSNTNLLKSMIKTITATAKSANIKVRNK